MEQFMASIMAFGFSFAPYGWLLCQGQLLQIAQNSALFSLLGVYYGGNGTTNFNIPDLRGKVIVGMNGVGSGTYPLGQYGGSESFTLTLANMPLHTHTAALSAASATIKAYSGTGTGTAPNSRTAVLSGSTVNLYGSTAPDTVMNVGGGAVTGTVTIGATGTGTPFSQMQPYCAINYSIATSGIFPSRN